VLAAVSGGSDSTALLDLLHRWRTEDGGFTLEAGHFDHQLRPEAQAEQTRVEKLCAGLSVPCRVGSHDVARWAKRRRMAVHSAARELRYRFLVKTVSKISLPLRSGRRLVATGHQQDDQAETVLMKLFSGSGVEGLAGIRSEQRWESKSAVSIIRPLLSFNRAELQEYCRMRGLSWINDQSNLDPRYPRSVIRNGLLPVIEQLMGPRSVEAIARSAELLTGAAELIELEVAGAWERTVRGNNTHEVVLDYQVYISYLSVLRTALLQRVFRWLAGTARRVSLARLQALDEQLIGRAAGEVELGWGVSGELYRDQIHVWRAEPWTGAVAIQPGETKDLPGWGRLSVEIISSEGCRIPPPEGSQYCDFEILGSGPYQIRPATAGDRFIPLGFKGSCRVSDLLRDAGTAPHRRNWPVVIVGGKIAVIPPLRVADWAKLTPSSRRVVEFKLLPSHVNLKKLTGSK